MYTFFDGCKPKQTCFNGVACGKDRGNEDCPLCSFEDCKQLARRKNTFAFAYRDLGDTNRFCWMCNEDEFKNRTARSGWGVYVRNSSTGK